MSLATPSNAATKQPSQVHGNFYWDHCNIPIEAQNTASEVKHDVFGDDVSYRVNFHNLLSLDWEDRATNIKVSSVRVCVCLFL